MVLQNEYFLNTYITLYQRHTERMRQRHRQREKQAPCRKPDVGLDPGSPGSHLGLKVVLNHWATEAAPEDSFLKRFYLFIYFYFIYLFMRDREGRDIGRGRSRLLRGSPMWVLIPEHRITPWAEGRHSTTEPLRHPKNKGSFCMAWWLDFFFLNWFVVRQNRRGRQTIRDS